MRAETGDTRHERGELGRLSLVSCLLSPVSCLRSCVRGSSRRMSGYASAVPHSMQNFAPGWTAVWHLGQDSALSDTPHSLQNFALATTPEPHWGQCLACA